VNSIEIAAVIGPSKDAQQPVPALRYVYISLDARASSDFTYSLFLLCIIKEQATNGQTIKHQYGVGNLDSGYECHTCLLGTIRSLPNGSFKQQQLNCRAINLL